MAFDPDVLIVFGSATIMVIGFPLAKAVARRITATVDHPPPALPSDLGARLERIEQITEATQVEVERLAEGQRFTTKLLSERPPER